MDQYEDEKQYCFAPPTKACINCLQFVKDGMFCRSGFRRWKEPPREPLPGKVKEPISRW